MFFGDKSNESYTPAGRWAHSSVLVENKLYFFGGLGEVSGAVVNTEECSNCLNRCCTITSNDCISGSNVNCESVNDCFKNCTLNSCKNINDITYDCAIHGERPHEVFYLNLHQPFNITNPSWENLTSAETKIPLGSAWANAGLSDQIIYLFGGIIYQKLNVYQFNITSFTWNPVSDNELIRNRIETNAISDKENIYIFGGVANSLIGSPKTQVFNNMAIFNTVDFGWSMKASSPIKRASYSATLLSNGFIIYVGGYDSVDENNVKQVVNISQISLFDTSSSKWSEQTAKFTSQDPIESRFGHTSVLGLDDQIIIYGGIKGNKTRAIPDIVVLNTKHDEFEWTIPFVTSSISDFPSLTAHTANVFGNYMIVAFGNFTETYAEPLILNDHIYLMNLKNYTWIHSFEPINNPINNSIDIKLIIIMIAAGITLITLSGIGGFFIYKKRKENNAHDFSRTPDNSYIGED